MANSFWNHLINELQSRRRRESHRLTSENKRRDHKILLQPRIHSRCSGVMVFARMKTLRSIHLLCNPSARAKFTKLFNRFPFLSPALFNRSLLRWLIFTSRRYRCSTFTGEFSGRSARGAATTWARWQFQRLEDGRVTIKPRQSSRTTVIQRAFRPWKRTTKDWRINPTWNRWSAEFPP